jgi:peptidoglycan/xylan/chitin deacetylase (PgdA/CDA1 family)
MGTPIFTSKQIFEMNIFLKRGLAMLPLGLVVMSLMTSCKGKDKNTGKDSTKVVAKAPAPGDTISLDPNKHYIYLTWDDAPQPPGTNMCRRVFQEQGVKATFFGVGFNMFEPSRRRMIDSIRAAYPQFLLANHSFSHGMQDHYKDFYTHPDSAVNDFLHAEQSMKVPVKIIRMPGSNSWVGKDLNKGPQSAKLVRDRLDSMGYKVIGWDLEWNQKPGTKAPLQTPQEMVDAINKRFEQEYTTESNAIVILSHDRLFGTQQYADSLAKFITLLKQDPRNVFETIDHYPLVMRK